MRRPVFLPSSATVAQLLHGLAHDRKIMLDRLIAMCRRGGMAGNGHAWQFFWSAKLRMGARA